MTLANPNLKAGTPEPTALDTARSCTTRAHQARSAVRGRVNGLRALFGAEVAESMARPIEEFEEQTSEAFAYYEDAIRDADAAHARALDAAVEAYRQLRAELSRYRVALAAAAEAEQRRHARTPAARRKLAPWYVDAFANGLLGEEPF